MMAGVEIDGMRVMPEEISTLEDSLRLRIVVSEGKKHEVRAPWHLPSGQGVMRRCVPVHVILYLCACVHAQPCAHVRACFPKWHAASATPCAVTSGFCALQYWEQSLGRGFCEPERCA